MANDQWYKGVLIVIILLLLFYSFYFIKNRLMGKEIDQKGLEDIDYDLLHSKMGQNIDSSRKIFTMDVNTKKFNEIYLKFNMYPPIELLEKYYDIIGPKQMMKVAESYEFCHTEAHYIGIVVYKKTNNLTKSLEICGRGCDSGCYHGVLMQFIKELRNNPKVDSSISIDGTSKDYIEFLLKDFCNIPDVIKSIGTGNCFHALGHALAFAVDYNVTEGLNYCKSLTQNFSVYYCATGVFMENDLINYNNKGDFSYPCENELEFPAACYRYNMEHLASSMNPQDMIGVCLKLDKIHSWGCSHGLGFAYYKNVSKNPKMLFDVCIHGTLENQEACIDGAIQVVAKFNRNAALSACYILPDNIKDYCFREVDYKTYNTKKSMELYYFPKST